jgi:replication factor A1
MAAQLTRGAIMRTYRHDETKPGAILQVIDIKKIQSNAGAQDRCERASTPRRPAAAAHAPSRVARRYRLILSDGEHYQQGMLATQQNHFLESGKLRQYTIIRLNDYVCNVVAERRIVIVLGLDIVGEAASQIGAPVNVEQAMQNAPPGAAAAAAAAGAPPTGALQRPTAPASTSAGGSSYAPSFGSGGHAHQPAPGPFGAMHTGASPSAGAGAGAARAAVFHSAAAGESYMPISALNPFQNRFTIKARVTHKSDIRQWSNQRGEGKLFSVDLLDEVGGQIRATMFNSAADKFFPRFQMDKVYKISKGVVKMANKKFSNIPNDYEMTLNDDAEVELVEDDRKIAQQRFDFVPFSELKPGVTADILGVVTAVGPMGSIVSQKTQRENQRRNVTLVDITARQVELTIWGDDAGKYTEESLGNNVVIAVKNCRVSDYNGISLSSGFSSQFFINPDHPDARKLRAWYEQQGRNVQPQALTIQRGGGAGGGNAPRKTLAQIKDENLGHGEKADDVAVRGTITFFNNDPAKPPWYPACPTEGCNKKLVEEGGAWHCNKCNKSFPQPNLRYILSCQASDHTGQQWVTAFNECAEKILGQPASALSALLEAKQEEQYRQVFRNAGFHQYLFRCRVKAENVNDEMRVKVTVNSIAPLNFKQESELLLAQIQQFRF